jgi:hypothetical protein
MISEVINPSIIEDFKEIIAFHYNNNGLPLIARICDRRVHQKICENILKSVLLPCIPICNLSNVNSEFVEELLIKLMYYTPNTEILILPEVKRLNYMQHLVQNILILNHLQEFNFHIGCTKEIILELAKFCTHLKSIDVESSKLVDNNCVEHLLKLRHLQNLNVAGTSVLNNGYRALLSGLPEVQNIVWFRPIDPVLTNLTECFHLVTRFAGMIANAELLVQKCPNINELTLLSATEDASDLGELRSVSKLKIILGSCIVMRFSVLIESLGTNLTALEMNQAGDININNIINFCTVLNSLDISYCNTIDTIIPDRNLAHFQNLKKLKLKKVSGTFDFNTIFHMYVNLNEFHAAGMETVNETIVGQIVMAGGFRHLTKFVVHNCAYMSMGTPWLLVQNCPNLTEIGNYYTWPNVGTYELEMFLNLIRHNNLLLTFRG